jgi:hypothetical protein
MNSRVSKAGKESNLEGAPSLGSCRTSRRLGAGGHRSAPGTGGTASQGTKELETISVF